MIYIAVLRYDNIKSAKYPREYRQEQNKHMRSYIDIAASPVETFRYVPAEYTCDMAEAECRTVSAVVLAASADEVSSQSENADPEY